jgi:hypothetical protein
VLKRNIVVRITWIALVLALLGATAAMVSGSGYRLQLWGLRGAFITLLSAAAVSAIAAVLAMVSLIFTWRAERRLVGVAAAALLCGAVTAAMPLSHLWTARHVPPIHDITTDTDNPPEFVALLPERHDAPNPAAYGGVEVAGLQRDAYPDIQPLNLHAPRAAVFWRIVAVDAASGRIEASDQTFWFGFIDDVVVRVTGLSDGATRVDARSVSRVGRGDVGMNARRLRAYLRDVEERLASAPA